MLAKPFLSLSLGIVTVSDQSFPTQPKATTFLIPLYKHNARVPSSTPILAGSFSPWSSIGIPPLSYWPNLAWYGSNIYFPHCDCGSLFSHRPVWGHVNLIKKPTLRSSAQLQLFIIIRATPDIVHDVSRIAPLWADWVLDHVGSPDAQKGR